MSLGDGVALDGFGIIVSIYIENYKKDEELVKGEVLYMKAKDHR